MSRAAGYGRRSGRPDLKLLFNVKAEFADSMERWPIEQRARSAVGSEAALKRWR
jgi:uncharacterized protein